MKTTITLKYLLFTLSVLFGFINLFSQNIEKQPIGHTFNSIALISESISDTIDFSIKGNTVITPNYMTPYSQVECFNFGSFVECNTDSIIEMSLNMEIIRNSNEELVFKDSIHFIGNCNAELFLPECYTPSNWQGPSYTGYYSLETDVNESIQDNNFDTIEFVVSQYTFAKEKGGTQTIVPDPSSWDTGEPHSWAFGNYFYILDPFLFQFNSATFALGNTDADGLAGRLISIYIYKWDDLNNDGTMNPNEREKVAFAIYEIQGTESETDLITTPLFGFPTGQACPSIPEGDQGYVVMIEYWTLDQVDLELVASTDFSYGPMIFQSQQFGEPRYAGFLGINGNLEEASYSSLGFGYNVVPVLRLNLDMTDNVKNTHHQSLNIKLSPNPTNTNLYVEIDLEEPQKEVTIKIFDLSGRALIEKHYKNIKYKKINFDLTKFVAGAYFLQFVSETGSIVKHFVVQHK